MHLHNGHLIVGFALLVILGTGCAKTDSATGATPAASPAESAEAAARHYFGLGERAPALVGMEYWYQNDRLHWEVTWDKEFRFDNSRRPSQIRWRAYDLETRKPLFGWIEGTTEELEGGRLSIDRGNVLNKLLPRLQNARLDLSFDNTDAPEPSISFSLRALCLDHDGAVIDHTRPTARRCAIRAEEMPARTGDGMYTRPHHLELFTTRASALQVCANFRSSSQSKCGVSDAALMPKPFRDLADGTVVIDTTDIYPGIIVGTYAGTMYNLKEPMGFKLPIYVIKPPGARNRLVQISVPMLAEVPAGAPLGCGPEYILNIEGELLAGNGEGKYLPMKIETSYRFDPACRPSLETLIDCAAKTRECASWENNLLKERFEAALKIGVIAPKDLPYVTSITVQSTFKP